MCSPWDPGARPSLGEQWDHTRSQSELKWKVLTYPAGSPLVSEPCEILKSHYPHHADLERAENSCRGQIRASLDLPFLLFPRPVSAKIPAPFLFLPGCSIWSRGGDAVCLFSWRAMPSVLLGSCGESGYYDLGRRSSRHQKEMSGQALRRQESKKSNFSSLPALPSQSKG